MYLHGFPKKSPAKFMNGIKYNVVIFKELISVLTEKDSDETPRS